MCVCGGRRQDRRHRSSLAAVTTRKKKGSRDALPAIACQCAARPLVVSQETRQALTKSKPCAKKTTYRVKGSEWLNKLKKKIQIPSAVRRLPKEFVPKASLKRIRFCSIYLHQQVDPHQTRPIWFKFSL